MNADRYAPIEDYAIIGDCRTAALVSKRGAIDWLCLPQFGAPAVFARLLDAERGGCFEVAPTAPFVAHRRYWDESNVLETCFESEKGSVRLIDFMSIAADKAPLDGLQPQRELIRIVEGISGAVPVSALYAPRPNYARTAGRMRERGRLGWSCIWGAEALMLLSDATFHEAENGSLRASFTLKPGERVRFSLGYTHGAPAVLPPLDEVDRKLDQTFAWWRDWSRRCTYEGEFRSAVVRSLLTLKLLTYALSGAVVAAPTASLPETVGGGRNWDYRFCWLRDASLTLRAFVDTGHAREGAAFLGWLLHSTRLAQPRLQVLYEVYGGTRLKEKELSHLEGYRGSRPVRIGNYASEQLQLDLYGSVTLAAYDYLMRGGRLSGAERRLLRGFGRVICELWREPDHGIWEVRGSGQQNTYSKVMCWAALDRLLKLQEQGHMTVDFERFAKTRRAIRDAIERHGYNAQVGAYVSVFGSDTLDSSLLLMPRVHYCDANAPRMRGTFQAIEAQLTKGALVYRYAQGRDRMAEPEGAFGACSFWAVDYLARSGRTEAARRRFARLLTYANDVGLFAEEIDPRSGGALGNFPQAYTHSGLINAALCLAESRDSRSRKRSAEPGEREAMQEQEPR